MKKYLSLILALIMVVTAIPLTGIVASALALGDGNGDGKVSAIDARWALQVATEIREVNDEQRAALDINEDGKITAYDARLILQYAVSGESGDLVIPEDDEGDTDVDEDEDNITQEDLHEVLGMFGYAYDSEQDVYYTKIDSWQRQFGFAGIYDDAASYLAMNYLTLKIDFEYEDLLWRLQWWKGQYGVLEGAELGVYTKKPHNAWSPFYKCAEDENLLNMSFEYYESATDYNTGNMLFKREEQEHWWLTGFKFGVCDPAKNVIKVTLVAEDDTMADGIELGLRSVMDDDGHWNGFVKYRPGLSGSDFYIRTGNKFTVVWKSAGYYNYGAVENPEGAHTPGAWETTVEPTCTTDGVRVRKCTGCGQIVVSEVIPAAHTPGEWETTVESTCTSDGERIKKCTVCGEILETETIYAVGHIPALTWTTVTEATCTTDGLKEKKCMTCGEVVATEVIPATGHTAGEWVTTIPATETVPGVKVQSCTGCGAVLNTEEIPATGTPVVPDPDPVVPDPVVDPEVTE